MSLDNSKITIFLIDDDDSVRDALTLFIESTGMKIKSFACAQPFLDSYTPIPNSCMVLDFRMPDMSGLELQKELIKREVSIPIIFISGHADVPVSSRAFRAGAIDFLQKPFDNNLLLTRIHEAIDKYQSIQKNNEFKSEVNNRYEKLTKREKQVFKLIIKGHSNKESAEILDVSNRTIDVHRAHIMEKMQATNLAELMIMALSSNIM